ncbi:hypothetical protein [Carnobacterium maltaromaticum]|uniref:hypothetical protein n=1 Tax=Carnobacterium maltaromaticum TaxID=2751 RepID=UPI0039B0308F
MGVFSGKKVSEKDWKYVEISVNFIFNQLNKKLIIGGLLLLIFSRKMMSINRNKYIEMKYKIKYLEYYFMVSESKKIKIPKTVRDKIRFFILNNRYELLNEFQCSCNKKRIRIKKINFYELEEFSRYSDELKNLL